MSNAEPKGYNGWANWATWNVALWFGNDEGLYETYRRGPQCGCEWTEETVEPHVRDLLPTGTPDMDKGASELDSVDWKEIADAWNED
jgi:hypothetical protein